MVPGGGLDLRPDQLDGADALAHPPCRCGARYAGSPSDAPDPGQLAVLVRLCDWEPDGRRPVVGRVRAPRQPAGGPWLPGADTARPPAADASRGCLAALESAGAAVARAGTVRGPCGGRSWCRLGRGGGWAARPQPPPAAWGSPCPGGP